MGLHNNSSEDKMRQMLLQHEFDFDSAAWDMMNKKLDEAGKLKNPNHSGSAKNKKDQIKKYWLWLFSMFGIICLATWAFISIEKNNQTIVPTISTNTGEAASKLKDETNTDFPAGNLNGLSKTTIPLVEEENKSSQTNSLESSFDSKQKNEETHFIANQKHQLFNHSFSNNQKNNTSATSSDLSINKLEPSIILSTTKNNLDDPIFSNYRENENGDQRNSYNSLQGIQIKYETLVNEKEGTHITKSTNQNSLSDIKRYEKSKELGLLVRLAFETVNQKKENRNLIGEIQNVRKMKIERPYPWYFNFKLGVSFKTTRNARISLDRNTFTNRNGSKGYFIETNVGYRLRHDLSLETGISFSEEPYILQYAYYDNPINLNQWNIETIKQKLNQISLPIRLQVNLKNKLRIGLGGGVAFRSLYNKFSNTYEPPVDGQEIYNLGKDNYNPILAFWETGLGYDRGPWMLDFKYQRFINRIQRGFNYQGNLFLGNGQEWNFLISFGYRFQKYHEPVIKAFSTIESAARQYADVGFKYGVGLSTGFDRYTVIHSLSQSNLSIYEFPSPLKLGLWLSYSPNPSINFQTEVWYQRQSITYDLRSASSATNFYESGNFRINRFEIPLDIHYRISKNIKAIAGIGIEVNNVKRNPSITNDLLPDFATTFNNIPEFYKRMNMFWDLGLGYEWRRFSLDLKFRSIFGGNDIFNPIQDNGETFNLYSTKEQIILSLNYNLKGN